MEEASAWERKPKRLREATSTSSDSDAKKRAALVWSRMRQAVDRYTYRSIAEAPKAPGGRVCLFAVVYEIGAAVQSRGSDFTVTLRIADPSRPAGISATFFARDAALLPRVKSSGDVISLHNVMITWYKDDFFITFEKKFSSFALFESKVSAECSPYQTLNYHAFKDDKAQLAKLRTWLPNNTLGLKDLELQLSSLKSDSTFDLVCKVLHVLKENDTWIFYVWDGTDTPAAELQAISDAEAVASPPQLEGSPLPRDVLCKMPCVGTVLKIFSNKHVKEVVPMGKSIYWVRFWNITCKQECGIWKGVFLESSGVRLLSHEDGSVVDRLKMYDRRNANKVHHQPMASFPSNVAGVKHKNAGYSTLMESLTHNEVTNKVKTLVRVVAACPCRASGFRLLSTGKYCLRLTLEDPTARIDAYVHKDNLVGFFGGCLTEEVITKKMNKLLGIPEPEDSDEVAPLTRNPPWIWCCLMSYYQDENDPWGSRRYQIFDTWIRD